MVRWRLWFVISFQRKPNHRAAKSDGASWDADFWWGQTTQARLNGAPGQGETFFFLSFFKSPLLPFIVDCCLEAVQINRLYWSWLGWERRSVMDRHCMISSFCWPSDTSCWLSFKQILAPPSCQRTKPTDCIWDYDDISAIDRHQTTSFTYTKVVSCGVEMHLHLSEAETIFWEMSHSYPIFLGVIFLGNRASHYMH